MQWTVRVFPVQMDIREEDYAGNPFVINESHIHYNLEKGKLSPLTEARN